jgi:hypothetical protein
VPAMNALLTETGSAPNQVIDGALNFLDAVRQIGGGRGARGICH